MKEVILDRYSGGAILVSISTGAVQLGRYSFVEAVNDVSTEVFDMFNLVPAIIDTHDERANWARLSRTVESMQGGRHRVRNPVR